ncbi:MAG TPA: hypothetical protein VFB50_10465 [Chloroflexota bacterium]|nr:hypothetical protein [Chloroflexota bacterium]
MSRTLTAGRVACWSCGGVHNQAYIWKVHFAGERSASLCDTCWEAWCELPYGRRPRMRALTEQEAAEVVVRGEIDYSRDIADMRRMKVGQWCDPRADAEDAFAKLGDEPLKARLQRVAKRIDYCLEFGRMHGKLVVRRIEQPRSSRNGHAANPEGVPQALVARGAF